MPNSSKRYVIQEELGRGIVTTVYKAFDPLASRTVAIKMLKKEFQEIPRLRKRFLNEARVMAALNHRNILDIYDARVTAEGRLLIVMDYAERGSVRDELMSGTSFGPAEVRRVGFELADALAYAHEAGVIHRDVQPSNIFLTRSHGVRLADFGAAHLELPGGAQLTVTGETFGTSFVYVAPEQRMDARRADARSDVYGLGATLFNLATGRVPPDLSLSDRKPELLAEIEPGLARIIATAVRYEPGDRYPSAAAMRDALSPRVVGNQALP